MTSKTVLENLGRTIRRARESLGLTRARYAQQCGLSLATIKNVEYGGDLRIDTLARLAGGLGLSLAELVDSADPDSQPSSVELRALGLQVGELGTAEQDLIRALVRVLSVKDPSVIAVG